MRSLGATPPPTTIDIDVSSVDPVTVGVSVTGEVDMLTGPVLLAALINVVDTHTPISITVDMAGVPFLDAAGVTALIHAYNYAQHHRISVRLIRVQPLPAQVLHVLSLFDRLQVEAHS